MFAGSSSSLLILLCERPSCPKVSSLPDEFNESGNPEDQEDQDKQPQEPHAPHPDAHHVIHHLLSPSLTQARTMRPGATTKMPTLKPASRFRSQPEMGHGKTKFARGSKLETILIKDRGVSKMFGAQKYTRHSGQLDVGPIESCGLWSRIFHIRSLLRESWLKSCEMG